MVIALLRHSHRLRGLTAATAATRPRAGEASAACSAIASCGAIADGIAERRGLDKAAPVACTAAGVSAAAVPVTNDLIVGSSLTTSEAETGSGPRGPARSSDAAGTSGRASSL